MARQPNLQRLMLLYQYIEQYPGQRPGKLARLLGWHRSEVTRALPALEERGYLLAEDAQGRLWPYRKQNG